MTKITVQLPDNVHARLLALYNRVTMEGFDMTFRQFCIDVMWSGIDSYEAMHDDPRYLESLELPPPSTRGDAGVVQ